MLEVYEVTTANGGNVRVLVDPKDVAISGERAAVAHAAWRKLWENERDKWGNLTKRQSSTAHMLRKMCEASSVNAVKDAFTASIEFVKEGAVG